MRSTILLAAAGLLLTTLPAAAQVAPVTAQPSCVAGICQMRITPQQLLARAETLVREHRFDEAQPLIDALAQAPDMRLPSRFLAGYIAAEQGDLARAADTYKAILSDDPGQTRVRLELARTMLGLGQMGSADRQFRLAEQSGELPPDVAAAIRGARQVIRSRRAWRLDLDLGLAPDSNINNATAADRIDINLGDTTLPIDLNRDAQAKSGTGQTGNLSAGIRLPFAGKAAVLAGLDANGTNYSGATFDDYLLQGAAGAELRLSDAASASLEGVAAQRWFGGRVASRQVGFRTGSQISFSASERLGLQLDARHTDAAFDNNYSGWQAGLYATAEKAVSRTLVASAGLFGRRDWLRAAAYSSTELGANLGLGGELPMGINFGVSGSISRALFDAPVQLFSADPRRDWRYGGRVTLGNRKFRMFGFSPQVTLSYNRNGSSIAYYATDRLRLRFSVARYF
ncbi:Tetratricopeptide repeat-containing protein [Sphingomonas guangdongensis]|uniref:Tetratricopeptide repeat-containing protein n=1 Tax=Sphingomonas guangdongensis TaxID=1141890 RepID=A0A285QZ66_9SPHN|nr:surface lipoprotein assembly modifier [Sphingomonas guangdongensis]SOB87235.1 Tetratricopeptide repeat-containing protein [Sphingomonas guangdongensis]